MRVKLEYGRTGLEVDVPDQHVVRTLAYKDAPPLADPGLAIKESLQRPIGSAPLAEVARGRSDACVVICDITRPVPNQAILTPLLATLQAAGIPRGKCRR